jgi:hypothetical protein
MTQGVIFYNEGTKLLPRLIVALHSIKKHYNGEIAIISIGKDSNQYCERIAPALGVKLISINQTGLSIEKHKCFLEKSKINELSPFDTTLFIDSDVVVLQPFNELFEEIEKNDFIVPQFSDWSTKTGVIESRISEWNNIYPDDVKLALAERFPSVNVGVFGFTKNSELMKNWFPYTIKNYLANLPEEISCHLLLRKYKGKVVESKYNYSCKHDKGPNPVIIHYHGRKHCRAENGKLKYNGDKWVKEWQECTKINYADMTSWQLNIGDKALKEFVKTGIVI